MVYRYEAKKADKETRRSWLTVGQQVKVRADKHQGRNGTVTAVDKRFKRPYTVKVVLDGGKTRTVHYAANEVRISRF